jgi:SAM-dependent methyltransferase
MPDYRDIYARDAEAYHELVLAEDYQGQLPAALNGLVRLAGARVIEVGLGTGRVTRLLIDGGARVIGYERSPTMLAVARRWLGETFEGHVADIRVTRLAPQSAELAIAGWVLGHFCEWYGAEWQREIDAVLTNLWNALTPGGALVIIETLGTGTEHAAPPNAELAEYYAWLESTWGMQRQELCTDYRFGSVEDAARSIGFFFGPELERRVREEAWRIVPERTGLWWRRK